MDLSASVRHGDTFLLVGGYANGVNETGHLDEVYRYDPEDETWSEVARMSVGRSRVAAIKVPQDMLSAC